MYYDKKIIHIPTDLFSHLAVMVAAIIMIVVSSLLTPNITTGQSGLIITNIPQEWFSSPLAVTINIVITIGLSVMISTISSKFSIVSNNSILPILFFFLMQCGNPMTGSVLRPGAIAAVVVLLGINTIFSNYHKTKTERAIFGLTLLICAGTLIWREFILYILLMWIGLSQMRTVDVKSILASLLAIILAIVFYMLSVNYGILHPRPIYPLQDIKILYGYDYLSLSPDIIFSFISIIPSIAILVALKLSTLYKEKHDKISVRKYNMHINTVALLTFIFMLSNPDEIFNYLTIFNCMAAIEAARYFDNITTKTKLRFLFTIIFVYLLFYIIWIL